MIRKKDKKYVVVSKTTGRELGTYPTKKQAEERQKQVDMMKHINKGR